MDIIEAIKERRSVRSFNGEMLLPEVKRELKNFTAEVYNPFEGHYSVRLKQFNLKDGFKPTTYGMIKGACDFFMVGFGDDEMSMLSAGFGFEQVVLKAWQLGLGTCWIAATFKGTDFETGEPWPDGEKLRIVCPVGVAAKKSFVEKMTRAMIGSKNRKPFDEMFFTDGFTRPASPDNRFGEALEMMRLAPSSTNSQPWRALIEGDTVHFFYAPKSKISALDTGIGICHFYESEKYSGRSGRFYRETVAPASHSDWRYLVSYKSPQA